jgi:CDP-6-deoxy-D-xylo-4-hexulose-3-dehydrase
MFGEQNLLSKEDINQVVQLLQSDARLTMSTNVSQFERLFAQYLNVPYAVMVNSGSSANLLAVSAIMNYDFSNHLQPGDEILLPSVCWSTSMWPILQLGLVPVLVDTNPNSFQMDLDDLRSKITSRSRGIMIVHIIGNCVDMIELNTIVDEYNLLLIEDSCEALGSTYNSKYLGTFGIFGTYSFYYSHHITTIEGGMIVCHRQEDVDLLKCLRAHGWTRDMSTHDELCAQYPNIDSRFLFTNLGYNLRPTEINAVLGISQLEKLAKFNTVRKHNFYKLKDAISREPRNKSIIQTTSCSPNSDIAWFAFPITLLQYTDRFMEYKDFLTQSGLENRPMVTGNFSRQPVFKKINVKCDPSSFIGAEIVHRACFYVTLSCLIEYSDEQVGKIMDILFHNDFWNF